MPIGAESRRSRGLLAWLVPVVIASSGCLPPDRPTSGLYRCEAARVEREGSVVRVDGRPAAMIGRRTNARLYAVVAAVAPRADGPERPLELLVPDDALEDAVVFGPAAAAPRRCPARDGYTEALARFAGGATIDEVAEKLQIAREESRRRIGAALRALRVRYQEDEP